MTEADIPRVMRLLEKECERLEVPYVTEAAGAREPFRVLVSCLISLRTKDSVTREASTRLFALARSPAAMAALPAQVIEKAIYPAGFYRTKARTLKDISRELVERYSSKVPDDIDELTKLKGVGRKTANLVVTLGYGKPGICVDVHVHRISNRWGLVETSTPAQTEEALRRRLPRRYWIGINTLLVAYGQNVCTPVSPRCSGCAVRPFCKRAGVQKSR